MSKYFLIIDDSPDFRRLIAHYIHQEWSDALIDEYNPIDRGRPSRNFDWSRYDVLLLDYQLGLSGENGLDWLRDLPREHGDFPVTIMLTGEGSEEVAVKAMKLGVQDYVPKHNLSVDRLLSTIKSACYTRAQENQHRTHFPIEVPGYKLQARIGKGGMATAYLAQSIQLGRRVVLKVLDITDQNDSHAVDRFIQEYTLVSKLQNLHVVQIYEQSFTEKFIYIAMEYFSHGDLRKRIKQGIAPCDARRYLWQIADGLQAIHELDVVHRDLKPENILFRDNGVLAITDFGVAKWLDESSKLTRTGMVVGTPYYMSPEQGLGTAIDKRSDLYSLGVIFYEMLTGCTPYTGGSAAAVIYNHVYSPIPQLPTPLVSDQTLLNRLMAKDPFERIHSAEALIHVLKRRLC